MRNKIEMCVFGVFCSFADFTTHSHAGITSPFRVSRFRLRCRSKTCSVSDGVRGRTDTRLEMRVHFPVVISSTRTAGESERLGDGELVEAADEDRYVCDERLRLELAPSGRLSETISFRPGELPLMPQLKIIQRAHQHAVRRNAVTMRPLISVLV